MTKKRKQGLITFLFILPWLITFLIFELYPILFSFFTSFTEYSGLNPNMKFIGLDNYIRAFKDETFLIALKNTFFFVIGTIPFTIGIALVLAILLNNKKLKGREFFKAGFFLPSVISLVVISMMWIYMYSSSGLFNTILRSLGFKVESISWLASTETALPAIMFMDVWAAFGYYVILIYAGLQSIPDSLYEAAKIDGATPTQMAFKITLPMLKPTLFFVIAINTIRSFQIFSEIYTMTGGGPRNSTQTIVHYLYEVSFRKFDMGYGSAIAYILFVLVMIVTLIQKKALRSDY
ncbi:sugar ABC transporter permease [Oceanotoga sp. DSM 15011]|jgi:multiple sugar transport system permease protein|uniref:Carbohydrate ABC transporter membrane protein 1 (CUT1 family) n=1 Tax=Oceanotoga teriensis TaxID=515440 RepID=A0AA45C801_9BACT|nr:MULTISPECIES: sugar ABC transporter permease [Oceanotoga]MDN5342533.1 multiple sugar transport system permease protein [Oceanotoga sp.]MDO7977456.1 sugar ABC transporter permease [Oceanotoga teriensis]PWJ95668.1 carbohydrate ABC transporter membrane protein 1 (CUT1 family) [Oceanotoga teriensis]UYO99502.1 sugar ABC transporter permease [Oceanotoga sp. DSM 15011]